MSQTPFAASGTITTAGATKLEEFKRGWAVLLAAGLGAGVGVSALIQFTLGPFIEPLSREFGWTRAQIAGAGLGKSVGLLLVAVLVGGLADKYGARRVALTSQSLLVAGFLGMALLPGSLWTFYLGYGLLIVLGAGTLPMIWARAIVGWFAAGRGLALGSSLMVTGLIGGLTPSYVTWLIGAFGWRAGYIGLALLPLVVGLPIALLSFREPPEAQASSSSPRPAPAADEWTLREAMRSRAFWQLSLSYFLGSIGVLATLVHAVPLLTDRGLDRRTAAALAGAFGIAVSAGRLITGQLLDTFRPERVVAALFLLPAAGCLLLLLSGGNVALSGTGLVLVGFAGGVEGDSGAFLIARYFGRAHYGAIYGLLVALSILGGGIGPLAVGYGFDLTGSYDASLIGGIVVFLATSALLYGAKAPSHRGVERFDPPR